MLKNLQRKIVGDLRANGGQFFAVWLVVMLGTAFYGAMYPSGVNMVNSFNRTYDQLHFLDFQVQFPLADPAVVEPVADIPGVAHVEGRLVIDAGVQLRPDERYLTAFRLISVPDDRAPTVNLSKIMDGRDIQAAGEILLLKSFADHHDIRPGDTLHVWVNGTPRDLTVAGLAFNAEYLVAGRSSTSPFPTPSSFGVAWLRYSDLAAFSGHTGQINDVVIHLAGHSADDRGALEDSVRAALTALFADRPNTAIFHRYETISGGVIKANVNGVFPLMTFFSGTFLIGSTLVTAVLLARLVESERQRIGTLRALGVTRGELVQHYLAFGLIIGVTGGLVGSLFGYLNSFWVMYTFISYIAGGTLPGFVNRPQLDFMLFGFAVAVIGSVLAGVYPAWSQSAAPPGIALRPAAPQTPHALSRLSLRGLPAPLRWAIRSVLRVPGRSLGTALGVVAGGMMIFSSLAIWDTLDSNFDDYFNSATWDLRADLSTLVPAETLENQVAALPGVTDVRAVVVGPVSVLRPDDSRFETVAVAVDEADPFFDLKRVEGAAAFSQGDGVWIGSNLARVLGLNTGDTLRLRAFDQERTVKVVGVVSYAMGSPVFIPRSLLVQWTPGGIFPANTALVRVAPGQAAAVRDALIGLPGLVAVEVTADFETDVNHYLEYFRSGTLIFGFFGYILTLAVLFNTVNGSLRERRGELAILRALGSSGRTIALMVTLELLLMVLIGALIGIPIGREVGFFLNTSYFTDWFGQVNTLSLPYYVFGLLSMVIIVLLAEIPGLRAVGKIDLGQVSKSQSF